MGLTPTNVSLNKQSRIGLLPTRLTLARDGELLATFERPMPESNRPIIDLLMPRAIPLSYGQTLSDQESEYTVNATFDAH